MRYSADRWPRRSACRARRRGYSRPTRCSPIIVPSCRPGSAEMHFLDQAKIFVRSGAGGPGAGSFRREKFGEYGGPDGGDGGKGGDIIFEAGEGLNTLIDFRYTQHFRAPRGKGGSGSNRTGAGGDDLVIKVPVGTQVLSEDKEHVLADFTEPGQRVVLLKGGDGEAEYGHSPDEE